MFLLKNKNIKLLVDGNLISKHFLFYYKEINLLIQSYMYISNILLLVTHNVKTFFLSIVLRFKIDSIKKKQK